MLKWLYIELERANNPIVNKKDIGNRKILKFFVNIINIVQKIAIICVRRKVNIMDNSTNIRGHLMKISSVTRDIHTYKHI